jgi:N-acyl-L-homoserine lactone synthetase
MGTVALEARDGFADRAAHEELSDRDARNSFTNRVAQLLDKIDCRLADSEEDREAIFRLRYEAYMREGAIKSNVSRKFFDEYDETENVWIFGLYIDGELASSIRIHVASRDHPTFPSHSVFPDLMDPELRSGKVIIDPTRFVTDKKLSRIHAGLPHVTLRLCWLAAEYFNAEHFLVAIRAEHQAFYKRTFRHRLICEPRPYPLLEKPISLMTVHYPAVADAVHRRYPFFRSTYFERRMLFERYLPAPQPSIQPSAELQTAPQRAMEMRAG